MSNINTTILPHQTTGLFLTDGGLETTMVFLEGYELPNFAAFDLLKDDKGYQALAGYYRRYLNIAKEYQTGFILESPTWRSNPDWIEKTGYSKSAIEEVNKKAIELLASLKSEFEKDISKIILSGCIGPRGDGYIPGNIMTAGDAQNYHSEQIKVFSQTPVNIISAITMNYAEEAIGIANASAMVNLPVVISFTVEIDGKLPSGMGLKEAIRMVDNNATVPPVYYMINCAHPTHFFDELKMAENEEWIKRIRGLRANASCKSHAELDEATELDRGNPQELALEHKKLKTAFKHLNVFGGCCGTDEEHLISIVKQIQTA